MPTDPKASKKPLNWIEKMAITYFTAKNLDRRLFEFNDADWVAIETVCKWLDYFQCATRERSSTSVPMLSSTIAIFCGLQQQWENSIRSLPFSTAGEVRDALVKAHTKLSGYYFRFDASPYGTWAALLGPRISYDGLKEALEDDIELLGHLDYVKSSLATHYTAYYKSSTPPSTSSTPSAPTNSSQFHGGMRIVSSFQTYIDLWLIFYAFLGLL
ncbi:hypothetical protein FA13DRAFT_1712777 [Coprinellus micaceus]|uniref:Uncharacterized protein n=1 Tax=Coprinellus micaceus TaxID=71717 RepID=A0A4Y7SZY9_COPMI|nr:hypothetical protein FA13DRAFT_1712777 [Coprinellus micaceus]